MEDLKLAVNAARDLLRTPTEPLWPIEDDVEFGYEPEGDVVLIRRDDLALLLKAAESIAALQPMIRDWRTSCV